MTLPNMPHYRAHAAATASPASTCATQPPGAWMLSLVPKHPLTPLIQRAMAALATPSADPARHFGDGFVFPTKRELAKTIAQAQAPAHAPITPTLLVVLTLHLKLLRAVRDLSQRLHGRLFARAMPPPMPMSLLRSSTESSSTPPSDESDQGDDTDEKKGNKRARLTRQSNEFMTAWFIAHKTNPYPTAHERAEIANVTHLSELQVRNWFANMRKRHWKPQVAEKKPRCLLDLVLRRNANDT
ncbi:Aste57867_13861 [Aphanomyces stellatus]|uniref:Aste57867_13861 protein n=1 Tax=Aphanomyces stellatus TaxID=120398 RepID=A0A485KZK4_9STRA|nr:hypothetical protein As57867_013810 [Aphanomyces stellatus]VFT90692.1 Aste57867_13861 [Aphanomyces stellatus]